MILFPTLQFGGQEFPDASDVLKFAANAGFDVGPGKTVMSVGDVVGPGARPAWKLMYEATGAEEPTWNFKGKFLGGRAGEIVVPGDDLEADIVKLLGEGGGEANGTEAMRIYTPFRLPLTMF